MNVLRSFVLFAAVLGMAVPAWTGDIMIPPDVAGKIDSHAREGKKTVPVNKAVKEQNDARFRTWTSGSIDLGKAKKRVSDRYQRTTYHQSVKTMKLRLPNERMKRSDKGAPQLDTRNIKTLRMQNEADLFYREGPGYQSYQAFKEVKARKPMAKAQAVQLAQKFLEENGFLQQSGRDRVATAYVQERRMNEDLAENTKGKPDDSLLQQDVVFERSFEGKPVINSKIVVGLLPDVGEIVNFKHFNWTPVQDGQEKMLGAQELKGRGAPVSGDDVRNRLVEKIQKTTGRSTKSVVKEAFPAWFQTADGMIPVLAFRVGVDYADQKGTLSRDYLEVINLAGSDDALFPGQKPSSDPAAAN